DALGVVEGSSKASGLVRRHGGRVEWRSDRRVGAVRCGENEFADAHVRLGRPEWTGGSGQVSLRGPNIDASFAELVSIT
ncbi:MAG: hypothetical protein AAF194_01610, partial [Pseudomonadota bacterium]